jgi:hypothetical protein
MRKTPTNNALVTFLYLLMRDYLPAGRIEELVTESEKTLTEGGALLSGAYVAAYAQELAGRLVPRRERAENNSPTGRPVAPIIVKPLDQDTTAG